MENENDQEVEVDTEEELVEEAEKPEKPKLTLEQQKAILQRKMTKINKELGIEAPKPTEKAETPKSNELDYGQRAFLKTYGIAGADELALVKSWAERTGDQIDAMVEDEIFNAKLKGLRDQKAAKETLQSVSNSRNAQPSSKSKAEFWLDKPFDEVPKEFKQEVLNIKLEQEREGGKFTDQPVVHG